MSTEEVEAVGVRRLQEPDLRELAESFEGTPWRRDDDFFDSLFQPE